MLLTVLLVSRLFTTFSDNELSLFTDVVLIPLLALIGFCSFSRLEWVDAACLGYVSVLSLGGDGWMWMGAVVESADLSFGRGGLSVF